MGIERTRWKKKHQAKENPRREGIRTSWVILTRTHSEPGKTSQSQFSRRYIVGLSHRGKSVCLMLDRVSKQHPPQGKSPYIPPDLNHHDKWWSNSPRTSEFQITRGRERQNYRKPYGRTAVEDTPSASDMVGCLPAGKKCFFSQAFLSVSVCLRGSDWCLLRLALQEPGHRLGDNTRFVDLLPH